MQLTNRLANWPAGDGDVYVMRGSAFVKVRSGTNGGACVVGRDLHEGSVYPICFDAAGAKTSLFREIQRARLRAQGKSEKEVERTVDAMYAAGTLQMPTGVSMSYMMSPSQVLCSSPDSTGFPVGAWAPHVMIMTGGPLTSAQLGLLENDSKVDVISIHEEAKHQRELTIKVPVWSNGTPVSRQK